jgi:hypothetical protein
MSFLRKCSWLCFFSDFNVLSYRLRYDGPREEDGQLEVVEEEGVIGDSEIEDK